MLSASFKASDASVRIPLGKGAPELGVGGKQKIPRRPESRFGIFVQISSDLVEAPRPSRSSWVSIEPRSNVEAFEALPRPPRERVAVGPGARSDKWIRSTNRRFRVLRPRSRMTPRAFHRSMDREVAKLLFPIQSLRTHTLKR
ncbi:hypothetical protein KM043_008992 [Ampulex compressa]|nr:hypothetical protein KM043_008992 [Ampulex compressa]